MPKKVRKPLTYKTNHTPGGGIYGKWTKSKNAEYKHNWWIENKESISHERLIKKKINDKFNSKITFLELEKQELESQLKIKNDKLDLKNQKILALSQRSLFYENETLCYHEKIENNNNNDNNNNNTNNNSDKHDIDDDLYLPNNESKTYNSCFKYHFDEITYYIQLSLYMPISNIFIVQSIFNQKSNQPHINNNIPSPSQISLWRKIYVPRFNQVYLAYQFSSNYIFNNDSTMSRDGSSINGKIIESIVAVVSKSNPDQKDNNSTFEHIILGIPNISTKHGAIIGEAVVTIAKQIDYTQQCMYCIIMYIG